MSNDGSIYDIASDCYDRDIDFPEGSIYAVVLASYYGGKGYTTHRSEYAAIKRSSAIDEYSHAIIDCEGKSYDICPNDVLVARDDY